MGTTRFGGDVTGYLDGLGKPFLVTFLTFRGSKGLPGWFVANKVAQVTGGRIYLGNTYINTAAFNKERPSGEFDVRFDGFIFFQVWDIFLPGWLSTTTSSHLPWTFPPRWYSGKTNHILILLNFIHVSFQNDSNQPSIINTWSEWTPIIFRQLICGHGLLDLCIYIYMSHSQMLGKFEYGLPAKFWRLVGCTEMLSW